VEWACLDARMSPVRRLVVLAAGSDGSFDYASIYVHVNQLNNELLYFLTDHSGAVISEGEPSGTHVITLHSTHSGKTR